MNSSIAKKVVAFIVCIAIIYVPVALQAQGDDYARGEMSGRDHATGNILWAAGGFLCGCLATVYVMLVAKPTPPPGALVGKSADYIKGFIKGFRKKTRSKNVMYTIIGWSAAVSLFFTIWGSS